MYLRKAQAGSVPGYTWEENGQVIDVEDLLALELLAMPNGGFSEALPPAQDPEPDPEAETADQAPKRKGRPPLPRDEEGNIIRKTEISE